ncbi:Transmembrane protein 231 [Schistosoma japonicum]|nr:Transmembrane protein 231 [Schistosoma japonicum]
MKVYRLYELRRYYASASSLAFSFDTFVVFIITLVPWIISYVTGYFYTDSYAFPEKPFVSFNGSMLLYLQKDDGFLYYTNLRYEEADHLMKSSFRLPQISFYNHKNYSINEEEAINIQIRLPLMFSERVIGLTIVLFVDVTSWRFYNKRSQIPVVISKFFQSYSNAFLYSGDLLWSEKYLTPIVQARVYHENKMISRKILEFYLEITRSGYYSLADRICVPLSRESLSRTFDIELSLHLSSLRITTNPGFWYTIKLAWIQYLSIGLGIFYFAEKIRGYIYDKQMVRTIVYSTIPKVIDD